MKEGSNLENMGFNEQTPAGIIGHAREQILQFAMLKRSGTMDFDKIKAFIAENGLENIESYTSKTKEDLEKMKPGIVDLYNSLIAELKDPSLTEEKFDQLMLDAKQLGTILT